MKESIFFPKLQRKRARDITLLKQIILEKKTVLMAFQNKDEVLCSNDHNVMGKEKVNVGPCFVSTRNALGFCPVCSSFVVAITGHVLWQAVQEAGATEMRSH